MSKILHAILVGGLVAAASVALSGCYASEHSVVAVADRVQPLKEGHYCEYDYDMGTGKPGDTCEPATLARTSDGSYVLTHDGQDGSYTVSISSHTVTGGSFKDYALTEACYSDKDGSGCFVGAVSLIDSNTAYWVLPKCDEPSTGADPCKLTSEGQALAAFAAAGPAMDDMRKLVWQSN